MFFFVQSILLSHGETTSFCETIPSVFVCCFAAALAVARQSGESNHGMVRPRCQPANFVDRIRPVLSCDSFQPCAGSSASQPLTEERWCRVLVTRVARAGKCRLGGSVPAPSQQTVGLRLTVAQANVNVIHLGAAQRRESDMHIGKGRAANPGPTRVILSGGLPAIPPRPGRAKRAKVAECRGVGLPCRCRSKSVPAGRGRLVQAHMVLRAPPPPFLAGPGRWALGCGKFPQCALSASVVGGRPEGSPT